MTGLQDGSIEKVTGDRRLSIASFNQIMNSISWTNQTWNPVTGCTPVSSGCRNCYAADIANRFWGDRPFSNVQFHTERLKIPFKWKTQQMIFVNSMSDLFHDDISDDERDQIFAVMAATPHHIYQVLTKRSPVMQSYLNSTDMLEKIKEAAALLPIISQQRIDAFTFPLPNLWLGVSVENQRATERIKDLIQLPAAVRFLSCEPLLEKIDISGYIPCEYSELAGGWIESFPGADCYTPKIHQVIIGGESGAKSRLCKIEWIEDLVGQCKAAKVPTFVKQLGAKSDFSKQKGKKDKVEDFPASLQIREYPIANTQGY